MVMKLKILSKKICRKIKKIVTRFKYRITNIPNTIRLKKVYLEAEQGYLHTAKMCNKSVNKFMGEGENLYLNKWRKISKFVSPVDYRLFSQYIGENPNICPEYVLHNIIEPIFLPRAYQQFYNDKNMYDKLLPKKYLAKSVFRCIDGICCNENYEVINQCDDSHLLECCKGYDQIIVKPTRNTGNGNRILFYDLSGGGKNILCLLIII